MSSFRKEAIQAKSSDTVSGVWHAMKGSLTTGAPACQQPLPSLFGGAQLRWVGREA